MFTQIPTASFQFYRRAFRSYMPSANAKIQLVDSTKEKKALLLVSFKGAF